MVTTEQRPTIDLSHSAYLTFVFKKTAIIKRGKLNRKQSMDLLEGLDFDFLNVHKFLDNTGSSGGEGFAFDGDNDFFFDQQGFGNDFVPIIGEDEHNPSGLLKLKGKKGRKPANHSLIAGSSDDVDLSMYSAKAVSLNLVSSYMRP